TEAARTKAVVPMLEFALAITGIPIALRFNDEALLMRCSSPQTLSRAYQSDSARIAAVSAAFAEMYMHQGREREARRLLHRAISMLSDIRDLRDFPITIARFGA